MIAVTIGVGDKYREMAELAAASVRRHTGLQPVIITETPGEPVPARWKLRLLDLYPDQTVLYFDGDARLLRPWNVAVFEGTPWPVVCQDWSSGARTADCKAFRIDPDRYFASGFWIAGPAQRDTWRRALIIATDPGYTTAFKYEQSALNTACQRMGSPLVFLDRRHWWIATIDHPAPLDTVCVALGGALDGPDRIAYDSAIARAKL